MRTCMTLFGLFTLLTISGWSQTNSYPFEPSPDHPFGLPNPEAPTEIMDWSDLIGECHCRSVSRNPDGSWQDTVDMTWRFKYIMNGWGVQDETLKMDGSYSGSIRQYIPDSSAWYVHYYSSAGPTAQLPSWQGVKHEHGQIILYRDQTAPNGIAGDYRITFSDISPEGFKWAGEWVDKGRTTSYPTWYIDCTKKRYSTNEQQHKELLAGIADFSKEVVAGNAKAVAEMYTEDGKIFPGGRRIMEGQEVLEQYWTPASTARISYHKITPEEIKFIGDYAYDFGYYEGKTTTQEGETSDWAGKYVIVWKRVGEEWKIYLDIWNRI
ncbi:MAG: nuclear transport factor 2 family protein [Bacteroidota bacterium]